MPTNVIPCSILGDMQRNLRTGELCARLRGSTCRGHKRASGGALAHRKGSAAEGARKRAICAGSDPVSVTSALAAGCNQSGEDQSLSPEHVHGQDVFKIV